jgi:drug/metabolite transporter (DMT)-like permease
MWPTLDEHVQGVAFVLVSAFCFGLLPIFARLAYPQGVLVNELLLTRFVLAFVLIGIPLLLSRKLVRPGRKDLLILIGLGSIGYFLQSFLYFRAIVTISVSIASLILYTYPALVTLSAYLLGWEKASTNIVSSVVLSLSGLVLVANPIFQAWSAGELLALGAAVSYTLYIVVSTRVLQNVRGEVAAFWVMGSAALSFAFYGAFTGTLRYRWTPEGWVWVVMLSICTAVAVTLFFRGIALIGSSRSSLISLFEPITSVFFAFLLFGDSLTVSQWIGAGLILVGAALAALTHKPKYSKS